MNYCVGKTESKDSIYSGNANIEIQLCVPNIAIENPQYAGYVGYTPEYGLEYNQFFASPTEGGTVNVRSASSESTPVIGTLKYGETIKITRKSDALTVYQILFNGHFGYVTSNQRIV